MRIALARKIAGNARKRPPRRAAEIRDATCQTSRQPPEHKANEIFVPTASFSAENLRWIISYVILSKLVRGRARQQTNSLAVEAANALKFRRMMNWHTKKLKNANAGAPTAIDRASMATQSAPCSPNARVSVASATVGAAPKRPEKLLGRSTSARLATASTTMPPAMNRTTYSMTIQ
jgi:hypothetical protein